MRLHSTPDGRQVLDVFTCLRIHTHLDAAGKLLSVNGAASQVATQMGRAVRRPAPMPSPTRPAGRPASIHGWRISVMSFRNIVEGGATMESVFGEQTFAGARDRYLEKFLDRVGSLLERELALISRARLAGYFLIVADLVRYCRGNNIMVQGRGSAATAPFVSVWASRQLTREVQRAL